MASITKRQWTKSNGSVTSRWRVEYRKPDGGRATKEFGTQREARRFRDTVTSATDAGFDPSQKMTIAEALDAWLAAAELGAGDRDPVEPQTLKSYRLESAPIREKFGDRRLGDLTRPDVVRFRDDLVSDLSRPMAKKAFDRLKAALNHAQDRGVIPVNPAARLTVKIGSRHKRVIGIPSRADVAAVMLAADRIAVGDFETADPRTPKSVIAKAFRRYRPILYLLRYGALRPSEARGLPWDAVDFERGAVSIYQRADQAGLIGPPKSNAGRRTVEIPDLTMSLLREWKACQPGGRRLVFGTSSDRPEQLSNIRRRGWERALELAQVEPFELYGLRRFRGSELVSAGVDLKTVQRFMGHENIQTTLDIYAHLIPGDDDRRREAIVGV